MAGASGPIPADETLDALLLRSLLDESADRVYVKDVDSRFLWLSHSAAAWFGRQRGDVVGRTDADFFTEAHAEQARADEQHIMRTGLGRVNVIERETWPDQPDTWVSSTKLPLRDSRGTVIGTWGISRDDTERVLAEQLLAERSAKLEQVQQELVTVLDGSPDGMMRFDRQLRHVYVNPAAETTLGMVAAQVLGRTNSEIGHPPEAEAWKIALERPGQNAGQPPSPLAVIPLRDEALSVSAIWGRAFQNGNKTYGHVLDPRTGEPVDRAVMAALVLPSATETDALSTALLTLGTAGLAAMTRLRPASRALVLSRADGEFRPESTGIAVSA
jgi:PAS domain S-box-containing protein